MATFAEVVIRPWQPDDDDAVWAVLQEGSHSNINSTFLLCLKKPVLRALGIVVILIGLANGLSTLALVPCFICGIGVIYALSVVSSYVYLYSSTLSDIKDIQQTYISNPDNHFWVAECDNEVVGTIAIVKRYDPDIDAYSSTNIDDLGSVLRQKKIAWLRRMVVRNKFRGMGIAKCLLNESLEFCKRRDYHGVFLITTEVHHAARSLYSNVGFELIAIKPYKYLKGLVIIKTYEFFLSL
ncbi:hypothetical protein EGW08_022127 [Elysia chlorotica]|uniref:N-acetyltransferase domain-containing protein n=1 Tax=Elysia chlorotica TaxID=188477 RepID=A0A433SLW2_ELYCH|nr:hypothetical protein EGW08_022127 [Elysia chlorotica]